jgi:hypothetical protein
LILAPAKTAEQIPFLEQRVGGGFAHLAGRLRPPLRLKKVTSLAGAEEI